MSEIRYASDWRHVVNKQNSDLHVFRHTFGCKNNSEFTILWYFDMILLFFLIKHNVSIFPTILIQEFSSNLKR